MVRIESTTSAGKASAAQKARKTTKKNPAASAGKATFAQSLSEAAGADALEALEAQQGATEVAGDIGLLALQERAALGGRDQQRARGRAIAYGEGLIERLQALHVRLLSGVVSEEELLGLQGYFAEDGNREGAVEDEKLRSILGEIELRVQVELAKKRR